MSNISGRLNLRALESAIITTKKGAKCLVIPIAANHLFESEKGNIYLDVNGREHLDVEKKQTHIVSQSLPKDVYAKLKEDGKYAPTLGNFTNWSELGGGEPTPSDAVVDITPEDDDLPF